MPKINRLAVKFILIVFCFVYPALAEESLTKSIFTGRVNADNIHIRADATVSSSVISNLEAGDYLEVISESYGWYKIKLPARAPSFIRKDLVSLIGEKAAKVAKESVNIRLRPDEKSPIIGKAQKDEIINISAESGDWYRITPVAESFGWVNKKFIDKDDAPYVSFKKIEKKIEPLSTTPQDSSAENKILLPENPPEQEKNITLIGIINPYGRVFNRPATHKLVTGNHRVFLLKGNRKSLEGLNYRRVKVIGKIIENSKKYPILEIEKMEALD